MEMVQILNGGNSNTKCDSVPSSGAAPKPIGNHWQAGNAIHEHEHESTASAPSRSPPRRTHLIPDFPFPRKSSRGSTIFLFSSKIIGDR